MLDLIAYIDPATTTLIWQILAGIVIVFGVVLGIWWTKITTFFKSVWAKIFNRKKNSADTSGATDEALEEILDEESGEELEEKSDTDSNEKEA